jgi:hypothetical protein
MSDQVQNFTFVDRGNEFECSYEIARAADRPSWWWFSVSSDTRRQRYAPFQMSDSDTEQNVKQRILEYYDRLLESRATPATSHWQQRRAQRPVAAVAAVAAPEAAPAP